MVRAMGYELIDDYREADLILINGRVYTLDWAEPSADGTAAADAPNSDGAWMTRLPTSRNRPRDSSR